MKQIENKPAKLKKFIKYCKPKDRKYGMTVHRCVKCGRIGAHVGSYGIHLCRQCFREIAPELGFRKYY